MCSSSAGDDGLAGCWSAGAGVINKQQRCFVCTPQPLLLLDLWCAAFSSVSSAE